MMKNELKNRVLGQKRVLKIGQNLGKKWVKKIKIWVKKWVKNPEFW